MRPGSKPTMTPEKVRLIRELHARAAKTSARCYWKALARAAGVSVDAARSVVRGQSYAWVP